MHSVTEVPISELEELKKTAAEIQRKIDALTAPTSLAKALKNIPYGLPRFEDQDCRNPVVFSKWLDSDVWKHFLAIGKYIHSKNGVFIERNRFGYYPYYVDHQDGFRPKRVSDLTKEEVAISAEMLDRMIEIYNEYMVKLHTQVVLRDYLGCMKVVPVTPPDEMPIERLLEE